MISFYKDVVLQRQRMILAFSQQHARYLSSDCHFNLCAKQRSFRVVVHIAACVNVIDSTWSGSAKFSDDRDINWARCRWACQSIDADGTRIERQGDGGVSTGWENFVHER